MSARVEAAANEWGRIKGLKPRPVDVRQMHSVLAAADAVMFDDAAVERTARIIFWAGTGLDRETDDWEDLTLAAKESWLKDARAVIAALKGDDK